MNKILMVVNEDRFFLSHRLPVALAAQHAGFDVKVVAKDTGQLSEVSNYGLEVENLPIDPTGMNPVKDLLTMSYLFRLFKREKPKIVHLVGMKNILWGSVAAKFAHVPGVVEAISGLGGMFNGNELNLIAKAVLRVIRFGNVRKGVKAIFQNNDDLGIFLAHKVVRKEQVSFIKGSGIDLNVYSYEPELNEVPITIIFTARMIKEKGVMDLIEAAERLREQYSDKVRFWLCGRLTHNSSAITEEYMKEHCDGHYIAWLGLRHDVKDLLKQSHIMAFPSYYREGLPKSLIEAAAIGRPIITCNSVGCKDVVDDGVNGFLINPKDVNALKDRLKILIEDETLRKKMGQAARHKAEREFSIDNVINKHLKIYNSLI